MTIAAAAQRGAKSLWPILAATLACFVLTIAIRWPGTLTPDSSVQLDQARSGHFTDWHPPLMARIWRLWPQPAAMLVLQAGLHWFGIFCLAARVGGRVHVRWAWAMVAVGLTPIAANYVGILQKDSLLGGLMLAAFGVAAWSRVAALALSILGSLVRVNGVFAAPPLWLSLVRSRAHTMIVSIASVVAGLLLIPLSISFNHSVLGAERSGVERSLQLYDLAGIAHYSGDDLVLPVPVGSLDRCYTPLFWDTLATERCSRAFQRLNGSLSAQWLTAIERHPLAYAEHRLSHFNREIFFLVPAMQQCVDAPDRHRCDMSARGFVVDAVTKNALLWPVTWLVAGLFLLFARPEPFVRALCLSGWLYGTSYLALGVAADFRYFYWTELAIQAAIVMHFAEGGKLPVKPLAITFAFIWGAGYLARYAAFF